MTNFERVIFIGIGVYIDDLKGSILTFHPDGTAGPGPYTIDLSASPANVANDKVDVDDPYSINTGGATRVPLKPGDDKAIIYLSARYLRANPGIKLPPYGYDPYERRMYEFMSVQYSDNPKNGERRNQRYYGFHGVWFDGPHDKAYVALWDGGTSLGDGRDPAPIPKNRHVRLGDPTQIHPTDSDDGIQPEIRLGQPGPIFVNCVTAENTITMPIPKLPAIAMGGLPIDNCRHSDDP